jgi:NADH:ubiquinone oxidoreductase subunit 2 (subunit N)
MLVLVVFGVLNAAIAAAYYLRILASCYLRPVAEGVVASDCRGLRVCLALCSVLVLAAFLRPGILFDQSQKAVEVVSRAGSVDDGRMARQDEQSEPARVSVGRAAD